MKMGAENAGGAHQGGAARGRLWFGHGVRSGQRWKSVVSVYGALVMVCGGPALAQSATPVPEGKRWTLVEAAKPYRGITIHAAFQPRPSYDAAIQMIPEFERITGIKVDWTSTYYEQLRKALVTSLTGGPETVDVVLIDVIWIGEFASEKWVAPLAPFMQNPALADPDLDLTDFFPMLLNAFGTWDKTIYGLPFDTYAGLLYYNKRMLRQAGFDRPPDTWMELKDVYGAALTKDGHFAFALQSHPGETQSCDSFLRFVGPFGGSLLTKDFEPNLSSKGSIEGLQFRQALMRYMPPEITDWDHEETLKAMADGRVAMITEWSGYYKWLADPKTSKIADDLGVAMEPAGPAGRKPPVGGFTLGINAHSSPEKQAAAWLFIQWLTSKQVAPEFIRAGGAAGRKSVYEDEALRRQYPYFDPLVMSWTKYGNPLHRPRIQEWYAISRVISEAGTDMMRGKITVEDGAKMLDSEIRYILYQAGYYKGRPRPEVLQYQ